MPLFIIIDETITPATAAIKIAIGIAKVETVLFLINIKPKHSTTAIIAISVLGFAKFPNSTKVEPPTIIPLFLKPTNAINTPNAQEIIAFKSAGIASIIHFLTGVRERMKNIIPATVNTIKDSCQVNPTCIHNVYVKYAFKPMPALNTIG